LEYEKRKARLVAISVDPPKTSLEWKAKRGFTFTLLSDPKMKVIEGLMHIRNPQEPDLAIHAIYILDSEGKVFYRKVGRRRALSKELLAAMDHFVAMHPRAPKREAP
jgi:peroxiredoxin